MENREHESRWNQVKGSMAVEDIHLGRRFSKLFKQSPKTILQYMSLYKFAAKMIGKNRKVLDIGCLEGFGSWLLAFECGFCNGIDSDPQAIDIAKKNFQDPRVSFECADYLSNHSCSKWDAVVVFNELNNIHPDQTDRFMEKLVDSLSLNGILIISTSKSNVKMDGSGSERVKQINPYSPEEFKQLVSKWFEHTFFFSTAGENINIHFNHNSRHCIALGCKYK